MTLYDVIMGQGGTENFSSDDWARLGRGEIEDQDTIDAMLAEGYDAVGDDRC